MLWPILALARALYGDYAEKPLLNAGELSRSIRCLALRSCGLCWDSEHGRNLVDCRSMWCPAQKFACRIRSAARFFPVPRRHLIGKGIRHFGSPDSSHVMRSDYQLRCNKRIQIIKFDTRYQIKPVTKLLKYRVLQKHGGSA